MHIDFRSRGIVIALAVIAAIATLALKGLPPQGIDLKGGGELRYTADTEDIDIHISELEAKRIGTDIEAAKMWRSEELKDMGGGTGGGRGSFNRLSGIRLNNLSLNGSFFSS